MRAYAFGRILAGALALGHISPCMERHERFLYHQIHPVKLATDVLTAAVAAGLLWQHRLILAVAAGFAPSIVVSIVLIRWANLEQYRRSAFGRYVSRFMTRRVELARFAGLIPLWGGAWARKPGVMLVGGLWIVGCWLWGIRQRARDDPAA